MRKVWTFLIAIILTITVIPIILDIAPTAASATIWYVDDIPGGTPSEDFTSIQDAVNASQPGDTVFVYSGFYDEDVIIEKTINLTGENRDTTIINGSVSNGSIWARYADYINVSGFTLQNGGTGISIYYSNFSRVENCKAVFNIYGIIVSNSNGSVVMENIASNNSNYDGIYLDQSNNTTIENNVCINNNGRGIYIRGGSSNNHIIGNNLSMNRHGLYISELSNNNTIINNSIYSNTGTVAWAAGISIYSSYGNIISNNTIINNKNGLSWNDELQSDYQNKIFNCTIKNSSENDIRIGNTWGTLLNTTFNKSSVYHRDTLPSGLLTVNWFLHVNIKDYLGNPVPNTKLRIEDNENGSYNKTFTTDGNGQIKWIPITEYTERDPDGDTIGNKIYYTSHRIIAWNNTLVGYAYPEPFINESKTVTIILYNGTFLELEPGWNLISLPRPQSDTNPKTILQSIEKRYDAVQWYNITDINDQWKHYHISKPLNLNDLNKINHTIGFWIHITDTEGTTLVALGDELSSDQNISIYPGWNLVGYPSKSNKTRDIALDNLFFNTDVDSIWTYNATTQKWVTLDEATDYFEIGKGYWIHSKVTEVWNVPL